MAITVDMELCSKDHECPAAGACPVEALAQEGFNAPTVDADSCIDCGVCCDVCPTGALKLDA